MKFRNATRIVLTASAAAVAVAPIALAAEPSADARAEQTLAHYRGAVEELAGGALDGETFRVRTRGLRIGIVVDGESVWLYDTDHGRWVYGDGTRLSTYATDDGPRAAAPDPGHAPTQVVSPDGP